MRRIKVFPFWRKQYLFHHDATSYITLLKLYHPYNSIAKLNWWLWKKNSLYQYLFTFNLKKIPKLYHFVNSFTQANPDYVWAINRGTKSIYQKSSGLFISKKKSGNDHKDFFFKWGDSKHAIESIKKEAAIFKELGDCSFVPNLIQYKITESEAYYTTEIIHGSKYTDLDVYDKILKLINEIQSQSPHQTVNYCLSDNVSRSFHHGDFAPWNLIVDENTNTIKAIDWEFCGIYPAGFDLLYYIFSIEFLIRRNSNPEAIINDKYSVINDYYRALGISDWRPYLKEFAAICSKRNANTKIGADFLKLLNYRNRS